MAAEARLHATGCPGTRLPVGATLLEVGGGTSAQRCQLAAEGFDITAIEPTGEGFGKLRQLGDIVLELAAAQPTIAPCKAEDFISEKRFDAFSLNVMEHIDLPDEGSQAGIGSAKPGTSYHFLCLNYYTYEPHFNIPTTSPRADMPGDATSHRGNTNSDPKRVWRSLNWITVPKAKRFAAKDTTLTLPSTVQCWYGMLERADG